jgi:hypothetical protein
MNNTNNVFSGIVRKGLYRVFNGLHIKHIKGDNRNGNTNFKYTIYKTYNVNKRFLSVVL